MRSLTSKLGNPFLRGSLGSVILGIAAVGLWGYLYLEGNSKKPVFILGLLVVSLIQAGRTLFLYRKLKIQRGMELLDDEVNPFQTRKS
jgi:hypothetical protein